MSEQVIKLYSETLIRFLNNSIIDREYKTKSIFIPVLDYYSADVNVIDYNKSLNPVSLITRLVKRNDFDTLKKIFGNNNVFFFGKNSYFKINFSEFKKSELQRFISNINNIFNKIVPNDEDMVIMLYSLAMRYLLKMQLIINYVNICITKELEIKKNYLMYIKLSKLNALQFNLPK